MKMKCFSGNLRALALAALTMVLALGAQAENVAEVTIGGTTTGYATIGAAWSACNGKDATLKLLRDVDITSALDKSWSTDLSLDLNGHTLKQAGSDRIIMVHYKMTVLNGVLTRAGGKFGTDGAGIYVCYNDDVDIAKFVLRGVTMTNCVATGSGGAIYAAKNTQVLLENCTLRQNAAGGSGGAICTEGGATADGTPAKDPLDKLVLISTVITDNTAGTSGAGVYYKYTVKGNSCFAAGTKVLMADGSERAIEEVEEGDIVRTFDHEGGTNSTAAVFMTVKEPITTQVFVLDFADGYSVRCVLSHDFLMKDGDACKYVCLSRQNAADYVGKSFYAADGQWHELLSVTDGETVDEVYEVYSAKHLNSYADGLLTVPADVAHVLNIYKLGADLKADAEQLAADVAAYGLAEFGEISSKYGVSRAYYDAFGLKYGYVIVGKGLKTLAQIEALCRSTGRAASPLAAVAVDGGRGATALPKLMSVPKLTGTEPDPLADYATSRLTLGTGTIVTNNLVGSKPNNIYLEKSTEYSLIALANDRAGICAGVTPQWTAGQITAFYYANPGDVALFSSDNADYAVWYTLGDEGSYLKLAAGSQIVPPTVANAAYEIWKGDEIIAWNEGTTVEKDSNVKVVYTADDGYVFDGSSATTKEVAVNTSKNIATMTPPAAPFEPVASVTAGGKTTVYATLTGAWAEARTIQNTGADATVTMLRDATVESKLDTGSNGALTLDLNDCMLAYIGQSDNIIEQVGGTLNVVNTAMPSAEHYFTCDATTGLWTLTNEVTELKVKGGLLTGGRNSAIYFVSDNSSISNVNFVGNYTSNNGGAVRTLNAVIGITITDCTFLGNVAGGNGGAVSSGNFTMTDCRVESNVSSGKGGGLYVRNHASLVRTKVVGNKAVAGGVYLTFDMGGCFPAGVKILMADGAVKNVEDIAEGDLVATFDHIGGTNSSAAVFYVYEGKGSSDAFTLTFVSDATNCQLPTTNYLSIVDRHDLLLETTRKYVTVSSDNARQFIGSRFYNYTTGGWDELTGVAPAKVSDAHYSIYVRGHANCVANGMLTVPDDKDCFVNVYELDADLKADAARLAADIATYGLATPDDYPNIPLDDFEDGNVRYARIAIGKGLTTQAEILQWNEFDYGPVVAKKAASAPKLMASAPKLTSDAPIAAPTTTFLQVGEGVVVTGNVTAAQAVSNVHLDRKAGAVIHILADTTDLDVGVTLSTGSGVFGWTNAVNYASGFFSDDSSYDIVYTADRELELVPFVTVVPTVVEHTAIAVYQGETKLEDEPYLLLSNAAPVTVVYTADPGYFFGEGVTAVTNNVDTTKNPATAEPPAAPVLPVEYVEPVYRGTDGSPTNGIAYWTTNSVYSYALVASSESAVTWGESGKTSWYVVKDADVQIDKGVTCAGHVNLILCEGAKLTVANTVEGMAGISTDDNGSFTVYGQPDGEGEMSVSCGPSLMREAVDITKEYTSGAGIGGNYSCNGSNITINGGRVTATCQYQAAAIGGGGGYGNSINFPNTLKGGNGSNITINGGTVTATGYHDESVGIGGGRFGDCSNITINGGTVTASGSVNAITGGGVGIGSGTGAGAAFSNITINGGEVTATGGLTGAGIGGGGSGITINGGTVTATGAYTGAGIGSSGGKCASDITINGGTVTATGGDYAAGIGGGKLGEASNIVINAGVVTAVGGVYGAGIGGGREGSASGIEINGGTVTAKSGGGGAGIGGGVSAVGKNIEIGSARVYVSGPIHADVLSFGSMNFRTEYCPDVIGCGGSCATAAEGVEISPSAQICFNLTGSCSWINATIFEWAEEVAPMPEDFDGFVVMTPEMPVNRTLVGGLGAQGLSALPAFVLTNAVTGATIVKPVNDGVDTFFSTKMVQLPYADSSLLLTAMDPTDQNKDNGKTYDTPEELVEDSKPGDDVVIGKTPDETVVIDRPLVIETYFDETLEQLEADKGKGLEKSDPSVSPDGSTVVVIGTPTNDTILVERERVEIVDAAKPGEADAAAWTAVTNAIALTTASNATFAITSESLKEATDAAGEDSVAVIAEVRVRVEPKSVTTVGESVTEIRMDLTPLLTYYSVENGSTTNVIGAADREVTEIPGGRSVSVGFDFSALGKPDYFIHYRHDGTRECFYDKDNAVVRPDAPRSAYDEGTGVATVEMSSFSEVLAGYGKLPITAEPAKIGHTTQKVIDDGEEITDGIVFQDDPVIVVYTADEDYEFPDGRLVVTNTIDTSKDPAVNDPADVPETPVLRGVVKAVKTDGDSPVTTYHDSLTLAFGAIGADGAGTVKMLADFTIAETGAVTLPDGIDVALDLNGHKIDWTSSKGDALLYFAPGTTGNLTIGDSGTGGTISSYCTSEAAKDSALIVFCDGDADLTVNGGTFVSSNKVGAATHFFKSGAGDWTFNDGTFVALAEGEGAAEFLYCAAATGTTVIAGGTYDIRATASAAHGIGAGKECLDAITITGGDFDVVTACRWSGAFSCGNGTMVVNGGDFSVTSSVEGVYCFLAERGGTTVLSNGTFRAETSDGYAYAAGSIGSSVLTVAGGTYSSKAFKETAATLVGKEQSTLTLVGSPVVNNGATDGTAWNLAVQLFGAHFDFSGYTGPNLPSFAVFSDGTYGASYVTGDMTRFDGASIWAGYFSTRPYDWTVVPEDRGVFDNTDGLTSAAYPWVIDDTVTFTPATIAHVTASVRTNDLLLASAASYTFRTNAADVAVVYAAEYGYRFTGGAAVVTNAVNTANNPATADSPGEPKELERYQVTVVQPANGTVTASPSGKVVVGDKVTLTVETAFDAVFAVVKAEKTDDSATSVSVTTLVPGETYAFTMPAHAVTVRPRVYRMVDLGDDFLALETSSAAWRIVNTNDSGMVTLAKANADVLKKYTVGDLTIGNKSFDVDAAPAVKFFTIGSGAFRSWTALDSVTFDTDLANVGARAFQQCYSITNVVAASSLSVGNRSFYICPSLEKVKANSFAKDGDEPWCTLEATIHVKGGKPVVGTRPELDITSGESRQIYGKKELTDETWKALTPAQVPDSGCHFFKVTLVENKNE